MISCFPIHYIHVLVCWRIFQKHCNNAVWTSPLRIFQLLEQIVDIYFLTSCCAQKFPKAQRSNSFLTKLTLKWKWQRYATNFFSKNKRTINKSTFRLLDTPSPLRACAPQTQNLNILKKVVFRCAIPFRVKRPKIPILGNVVF